MNNTVLDDTPSEIIFLSNACTATRMLEKRRQLFEMQDALDTQKDEFTRKEDTFRRREDALRKKDLQLQESLIKFNKFLQENESKRTRATKRTADEKRQIQIKNGEAIQLTSVLDEQIAVERKLSATLDRMIKYQNYLSSVVDSHGVHTQRAAADEFPEVTDVLHRYRTLETANADLTERRQAYAEETEERRVEFLQFLKDGADEMLERNNEIASLQKEWEERALVTVGIMGDVEVGIARVSDKTSELGQIIGTVENLYDRFEKQRAKRKTTNNNGANTNGDAGGRGGDDNKASGGGGASGVDASHGKITESRKQQVIDKLDRITEYMIDYRSIIDEWDQLQEDKIDT